jgi:hypothetical protein
VTCNFTISRGAIPVLRGSAVDAECHAAVLPFASELMWVPAGVTRAPRAPAGICGRIRNFRCAAPGAGFRTDEWRVQLVDQFHYQACKVDRLGQKRCGAALQHLARSRHHQGGDHDDRNVGARSLRLGQQLQAAHPGMFMSEGARLARLLPRQ